MILYLLYVGSHFGENHIALEASPILSDILRRLFLQEELIFR